MTSYKTSKAKSTVSTDQVVSQLNELIQLLVHGEDLGGDHVDVFLARHLQVLVPEVVVGENRRFSFGTRFDQISRR